LIRRRRLAQVIRWTRPPLLAPSGWVMLSAPVQKQIAVKFSGFYIGELDTPVHRLTFQFGRHRF
jgi:hypothetical protein